LAISSLSIWDHVKRLFSMPAPRPPNFKPDLLRTYSAAALQNAGELLAEATLLRDHGHWARAYFLAIATIEEAGKALQAFDAQKRNLSDPAVVTKLNIGMTKHAQKINYALFAWAAASDDVREAIEVALPLVSQLKHGREPSMYCELRTEPDRAQRPSEIVRESAARDCVRLARDCVANANRHVKEQEPPEITHALDKIFTMKSAYFREILSSKEFWFYYVARVESGDKGLAEAVCGYEKDHVRSGESFK
jgi:AbiV family abortive infection protein